jgi:hypothetical protein
MGEVPDLPQVNKVAGIPEAGHGDRPMVPKIRFSRG